MKHKVIIIVILFSLIVCCTKITYSLFTSETSFLVGDGKIAEFIFEAKRTNHIELDFTDLKPGDTKEFDFQVSNVKDDVKTNVTTEYQITLRTFHFMPLLIELYKDDELVMTCNEKKSRNANNALVCNSDIWEMGHKDTKTENFTIKVSFPKEYNSQEYTELVDYIDIDISSWQKIG